MNRSQVSCFPPGQKAGFLAGLLYGPAAGLLIPFLQDVSQAVKATRKPREAAPEVAATGR